MANVSANLTTDAFNQLSDTTDVVSSTLGQAVEIPFFGLAFFALSATGEGSIKQTGAATEIDYADGSHVVLDGVTRGPGGDITASRLTATSDSDSDSLAINGAFHFHPDAQGHAAFTGGTATSFTWDSHPAPSDPGFDPAAGAATLTIDGALDLGADLSVHGDIASLVISENGVSTYSVKGNLHVALGPDTAEDVPFVSGTVTAIDVAFADGSRLDIDGAAIDAGAQLSPDLTELVNGTLFPGDDKFDITLPATIDRTFGLDAGAGNDQLTLRGGGARFGVNAGAGNDTIELLDGGHRVEGGAGVDTVVLHGHRADYTIAPTGDTLTVTHGADGAAGADLLVGVERIQFDDVTYDDNIDGVHGQIFRLYKSALGRAPDAEGMQYWMNDMRDGMSLQAIAHAFTESSEYRSLYPDNLDNTQLMVHYYNNILGRAPDAAGLQYWVHTLDSHAATVAEVLAGISESAENHAMTASLIGQPLP
jgi:hypothetical protein